MRRDGEGVLKGTQVCRTAPRMAGRGGGLTASRVHPKVTGAGVNEENDCWLEGVVKKNKIYVRMMKRWDFFII